MYNIEFNLRKSKQKFGKHSFVYRGGVTDVIKKRYGRENENICLKVFYGCDLETWGDNPKCTKDAKRNTTFKEATQIQNICAMHGLAPRVYGLEEVIWKGKVCIVQVTEDLGMLHGSINEAEKVYNKIVKLGEKYGWKPNYVEWGAHDIFQGKYVDFQTFNFTKEYDTNIKDLVYEYGKWGKTHYQAIPELHIKTFRKTEQRIKDLGLDKIDFNGKTVLDVGCSSGVFCNYAASKGAKRVIGIDLEKPIMASKLLSIFLGYYNNDYCVSEAPYYGKPAVELKDEYKYDIIFYLSMLFHIGYPKRYISRCNDLMIVEWNHWHKKEGLTQQQCEAKTLELLQKDFKEINLTGRATDHGNKAIWHCKK